MINLFKKLFTQLRVYKSKNKCLRGGMIVLPVHPVTCNANYEHNDKIAGGDSRPLWRIVLPYATM